MRIDNLAPITSENEARDLAIQWQDWSSRTSLSYSELAEWQTYLEALAESFDLVEEFQENGVI